MLRFLRPWLGYPLAQRTRRALAHYLRAARDARLQQRLTLDRLLALNADSEFARRYSLTPGLSFEEYRRRIPITEYADYIPWIERLKRGETRALLGPRNPLLMFTLTSGTTQSCKFIPITTVFLQDYRRGWSLWGIRAFDDHPALHRLEILQLASDYEQFRTAAGIPCGNISGLVGAMQSRIVRSMYVLPPQVSKIHDPELKYYTILRIALNRRFVGLVMTANPSTLLHLGKLMETAADSLLRDVQEGTLRRIGELPPSLRTQLSPYITRRPRRARELQQRAAAAGHLVPHLAWPHLQLLGVWTGGSARIYLECLRRYFAHVPIRDHGLSASEGRMTIPFHDHRPDGLLDVGTHYFEFIPEEEIDSSQPVILNADELQPHRNYYILLTTSSGLHRYHIRDVVRCTAFHGTTPLLEFLHKGAHMSSLTGEKLSESQVVAAVTTIRQRRMLALSYFTLSPAWGEPPHYLFHYEQPEIPVTSQAQAICLALDHELQALNCEYREKRQSGRLGAIQPHPLPAGTWRKFTHQRQRRLGGSLEQYKHPCLSGDVHFVEHLQALASDVVPPEHTAPCHERVA